MPMMEKVRDKFLFSASELSVKKAGDTLLNTPHVHLEH